jgi:two-component system chemotaxis sensor kinase CheA
MTSTSTRDASAAAGIELAQFHALFFDEAGDNLERMEQLLLALDVAAPCDEALNAIFRCVHSLKGGAATFGFADVAELTHEVETLLERLRRHETRPSAAIIDVLLQAGDVLGAQLARHRDGSAAAPDVASLRLDLQRLALADAAAAAAAPPPQRALWLSVGPLHDAGALAALLALFTEIPDLGRIAPRDDVPPADGMHHFALHTGCSDAELIDLFAFHVSAALVRLEPALAAPPPVKTVARTAGAEAASLRVSLDKVDQLINLVGELVIAQSMLAQASATLAPAAQRRLAGGFADLERHTRELQDAVMSMRMIPVSVLFSRFARLVRELSRQLGKQVELVTLGEATELDKSMVELIADPLMHLVRNSLDHGIEPAAQRLALGKREAGTLTLAASHEGGSIVIEVRDDGRGLSRAALLDKARERGLAAPHTLRDEQVWALIFAPGFSTAEQVTEVSGRGVGLDVVQRNIAGLGGTVEIESQAGQGLCVRVRLPLTLAIMDGLLVRVGDETYVLPLSAVVESLQTAAAPWPSQDGGAGVLPHRDERLPLLDLARLFGLPQAAAGATMVVVVEAEGARIALRVDALLGQQQVVVKDLEANYTRVEHIGGATLMGDGRVALILDVASLVRHARQ